MVYGCETWAMRVEDMNRLERVEGIMVRSMCGVLLREEESSDELLVCLGIVADVGCVGMDMWTGRMWRTGCQSVGG